MLDSDVAMLYRYKTKIMNQTVKRNIKRFSERFCFRLTSEKSNISKSDKFHDRFIIIDNQELYHCGASIKDLGKKCFAISKMEDIELLNIMKNII